MNFLAVNNERITLDSIRNLLIRLEDTIIFCLIERTQFAQNKAIYETPAPVSFDGITGNRSFLDYFLLETEKVHAKVRRYHSPDEYPFNTGLPEPVLRPLNYPSFLHPNNINVNSEIMRFYLDSIVPSICSEGDDLNYGSAATRDVECLQALSRRIHYGKFVAEIKFRSAKNDCIPLILKQDRPALDALITNTRVETLLLERLRKKALIYGQSLDQIEAAHGQNVNLKIPVEVVVELYYSWVIPLTKVVEVEYLCKRLDGVDLNTLVDVERPLKIENEKEFGKDN